MGVVQKLDKYYMYIRIYELFHLLNLTADMIYAWLKNILKYHA